MEHPTQNITWFGSSLVSALWDAAAYSSTSFSRLQSVLLEANDLERQESLRSCGNPTQVDSLPCNAVSAAAISMLQPSVDAANSCMRHDSLGPYENLPQVESLPCAASIKVDVSKNTASRSMKLPRPVSSRQLLISDFFKVNSAAPRGESSAVVKEHACSVLGVELGYGNDSTMLQVSKKVAGSEECHISEGFTLNFKGVADCAACVTVPPADGDATQAGVVQVSAVPYIEAPIAAALQEMLVDSEFPRFEQVRTVSNASSFTEAARFEGNSTSHEWFMAVESPEIFHEIRDHQHDDMVCSLDACVSPRQCITLVPSKVAHAQSTCEVLDQLPDVNGTSQKLFPLAEPEMVTPAQQHSMICDYVKNPSMPQFELKPPVHDALHQDACIELDAQNVVASFNPASASSKEEMQDSLPFEISSLSIALRHGENAQMLESMPHSTGSIVTEHGDDCESAVECGDHVEKAKMSAQELVACTSEVGVKSQSAMVDATLLSTLYPIAQPLDTPAMAGTDHSIAHEPQGLTYSMPKDIVDVAMQGCGIPACGVHVAQPNYGTSADDHAYVLDGNFLVNSHRNEHSGRREQPSGKPTKPCTIGGLEYVITGPVVELFMKPTQCKSIQTTLISAGASPVTPAVESYEFEDGAAVEKPQLMPLDGVSGCGADQEQQPTHDNPKEVCVAKLAGCNGQDVAMGDKNGQPCLEASPAVAAAVHYVENSTCTNDVVNLFPSIHDNHDADVDVNHDKGMPCFFDKTLSTCLVISPTKYHAYLTTEQLHLQSEHCVTLETEWDMEIIPSSLKDFAECLLHGDMLMFRLKQLKSNTAALGASLPYLVRLCLHKYRVILAVYELQQVVTVQDFEMEEAREPESLLRPRVDDNAATMTSMVAQLLSRVLVYYLENFCDELCEVDMAIEPSSLAKGDCPSTTISLNGAKGLECRRGDGNPCRASLDMLWQKYPLLKNTFKHTSPTTGMMSLDAHVPSGILSSNCKTLRKHLASQGQCFWCMKKGHKRSDCPELAARHLSLASGNGAQDVKQTKNLRNQTFDVGGSLGTVETDCKPMGSCGEKDTSCTISVGLEESRLAEVDTREFPPLQPVPRQAGQACKATGGKAQPVTIATVQPFQLKVNDDRRVNKSYITKPPNMAVASAREASLSPSMAALGSHTNSKACVGERAMIPSLPQPVCTEKKEICKKSRQSISHKAGGKRVAKPQATQQPRGICLGDFIHKGVLRGLTSGHTRVFTHRGKKSVVNRDNKDAKLEAKHGSTMRT